MIRQFSYFPIFPFYKDIVGDRNKWFTEKNDVLLLLTTCTVQFDFHLFYVSLSIRPAFSVTNPHKFSMHVRVVDSCDHMTMCCNCCVHLDFSVLAVRLVSTASALPFYLCNLRYVRFSCFIFQHWKIWIFLTYRRTLRHLENCSRGIHSM